MRKIDTLIIHCAETYPRMDIGADEIRQWHLARGFDDIGYHVVIRRNGALEFGRDLDGDGDVLEEIGAHALGYNATSIGVCLVGGLSRNSQHQFNYTRAQIMALFSVVDEYEKQFPGIKVIGHNDVSDKACPVFDVVEMFG